MHKTAGQISVELAQKTPDSLHPIEIQRAIHTDEKYIQELTACVDNFRKDVKSDFFVVVLTKNERLMTNLFRDYFFARHTCPTPDYDQSVFRYDSKGETLHYLWTIPSQDTCYYLLNNINFIENDERELLKCVLDLESGELLEQAKKYNGEEETTPFLLEK